VTIYHMYITATTSTISMTLRLSGAIGLGRHHSHFFKGLYLVVCEGSLYDREAGGKKQEIELEKAGSRLAH
jgi:hypothetical protein